MYGIEQHTDFQMLAEQTSKRRVLALFEYGLKTEVHTDASKDALGAILLQKIQEQKLSSYELEVFAVVVASQYICSEDRLH